MDPQISKFNDKIANKMCVFFVHDILSYLLYIFSALLVQYMSLKKITWVNTDIIKVK